MYKATVLRMALYSYCDNRGFKDFVDFNDKFDSLGYGFTSDCPEDVKKEITDLMKQMLSAINNNEDIATTYETDIRNVSRDKRKWR